MTVTPQENQRSLSYYTALCALLCLSAWGRAAPVDAFSAGLTAFGPPYLTAGVVAGDEGIGSADGQRNEQN
jgi:hypothetical protein